MRIEIHSGGLTAYGKEIKKSICFDEYKAAFKELGFKRVYSLGPSWDHRAHDRRLFAVLRRFDSTKAVRIHAQCPREYGAGEGSVNRLRKSAGFVCVRCTEKTIVGLTGGGPARATMLVGIKIYDDAFAASRYSRACAEAVTLFILIAVLSLIQTRLSAKSGVNDR